ncbi:MAG: YebC/PmpR family DNA-binding transcriptional regulator [Bacteroidetes bacterium]|nr:MAG: YebC/PmpR family DNA-binding transcriptional regulator [Bacteroidota bacterium]
MGRAFEFRKARKMKRWDAMAKGFTRLGKEIAMAVKAGGPDPDSNARLRVAIQNAKGINMPKDRIEAAIKRASSKDEKEMEEVVLEGYGPCGVAILAECATDNNNRTVANIRSYYNKLGGALGKTGSLDFVFSRKGVFKFPAEGRDKDELELELIDHGLEELQIEEDMIFVYTAFEDFGRMHKALEQMGIEAQSADLQRIALTETEVPEDQVEAVIKLIERIEEDDDVQAVYHNMK